MREESRYTNCLRNGKVFNEFIAKLAPRIIDIESFPVKVLYGFQWNHGAGTYVRWLFRDVFGIEFDYIVDDQEISYGEKIYRRNLFDYLNSDTTIVISSTDADISFLNEIGYRKNKNWFDMRELYGLENIGYFEYMTAEYHVDIIGRETKQNVNAMCQDAQVYSVSRGMSIPIVCGYLKERYPNKSALDIGCGKGGVMLALYDFGLKKCDGIEILPELCEIARENVNKMGGGVVSTVSMLENIRTTVSMIYFICMIPSVAQHLHKCWIR